MDTLTLSRNSATIADIFIQSERSTDTPAVSAVEGDYRLRVFVGPTGLQQLARDWDSLVSRMVTSHFWHRRSWFESYLKALSPCPDNLLFCAIYGPSENVVAILPLQAESRTVAGPIKVRTLELPRHDHLHLRDILIADEERPKLTLATIVRLLHKSAALQWDILALWHCLEDSSTITAARLESPASCVSMKRFQCSHLDLGSWEQISSRLSKSFRQNLRTANNRAAKLGGIRFETFDTLPELEKALDEFIHVESSGWKGSAGTGTAIKLDARLTEFYRQLIRTFGAAGRCTIHLLKHQDKTIGGLFLLMTDRTLYVPKVAYDEEHHRLSPVQLLLEHAFKYAAQHHPNLRQLNLTSDAGWFDTWQPTKSDVTNVYVFNSTPLGLLAGAGMKLAMQWQRWRQKHASH